MDLINNCEIYGEKMFKLMKEMFPICRSITGDGVRETLNIIKEIIPININEVPSGTEVFDWTVPREWNIKDAWIKNPRGEKIVDFKESNLRVLNYSSPINKTMKFEELKTHIFTLPYTPDWIPYMTSYYNENWGFCMSHNEFIKFQNETKPDEEFEVHIDSSLKNGYLTYGEYFLQGESKEEVLISTYVCHPSMCNDNLSGIALTTYLAYALAKMNEKCKLRYSYRFLFVPETIGSITWLSLNEKKTSNIKYGLVASCVGDRGCLTYKKSRDGNNLIDKIAVNILKYSGAQYKVLDFFPWGSDERQFCSPGFNLPVGSLMRTPYGYYGEYHTSADNFNFVDKKSIADTFDKYIKIIFIIENNNAYLNLNPKCEPRLGKRNLYGSLGGRMLYEYDETAMFWILNQSDGKNSLLDISEKSNIDFFRIKNAADALLNAGLLKKL
ncbi:MULTISPECIES: DUF4910 domain-containing protein [Clostridium]|uniref:DUF4910 domain-containing protein n=1 Tax=Clostridium TaxID=1485 RepID=UPI000826B56D|nr:MULTISPECIES: DUF4910 domain-containing protein [Clostridium]PJI09839.1 DUF4910 domain-containing protein [Clostridium sp. CT7]